jgi:hypothetical protein
VIVQLIAFGSLGERMQAIRGHFARGGRWSELIAVLLALAGCVLLLALVYRVHHAARRREPNHPSRLFRSLSRGLGLSARQRRILRRMAADLGLEHPAVMLLSPQLFREHSAAWARARRGVPAGDLADISAKLFTFTPSE